VATDLRKTTVTPVPPDNVRIPHRHSVPHTAPDSLALTTVRKTSDVSHAPTLAELIADIEAHMSAHMDERTASFEAGYKRCHGITSYRQRRYGYRMTVHT
jgi:hypothetical protein